MLNLTHEYKLIPTPNQIADFEHYLEVCRKAWNYALRERKDWFASRSCPVNTCSIKAEYIIPADAPRPTYTSQANALTKAKKQEPLLSSVHSQVLQQTLRKLETAFLSMWERGFGFPRFKKPGRMRSFVFPQMKNSDLLGDTIKLPKIGVVRMRMSRPIPSGFDLKQARIVRRASGWYVLLILQAEVNVPDPPPAGEPVGIDLGLSNFLATSGGELIARPRFFVDKQRQLKLLQRRLKHKKKGSKNAQKLNRKIAKVHEEINNTRKDFHFKVAHGLCDGRGMVFAENLNLKAMSKGMLSKHTLDAAFGQFLSILSWVCWKRGVFFLKVDASGTSQTCPKCHTHTPKDLSVRVHQCQSCGYTTDRDVAAAQVVEQRGLTAAGLVVGQIAFGGDVAGTSDRNVVRLANTRRERKSKL